jgi:hypothetical protein
VRALGLFERLPLSTERRSDYGVFPLLGFKLLALGVDLVLGFLQTRPLCGSLRVKFSACPRERTGQRFEVAKLASGGRGF